MGGIYGERRKASQEYNAPAYGDGTRSAADIDRDVITSTRGKYGTAVNQYEGQIGASAARQAQIKQYYDEFNNALTGIRGQVNQQYATAVQGQVDNAKSTQGAEQSANQKLLEQMQADAASRGATVDPSLFLKANQASASRAGTANSQATQLQNAKGAYDSFYGNQAVIGLGQRQSKMDQESKFTKSLRDHLIELSQEAGDFAANQRSSLDEANYNRALSAQALGVKASTARSQTRTRQQQLAIQQQNADTSKQRADWATSPSNPDNQPRAGKPRFTPDKVRANQSNYRNIRGKAQAAARTKDPDSGQLILRKGQAQKFIDALVSKGEDPILAKAAVMDALYGGVDARTRKSLHQKFGFYARLSKSERKKK